MIPEDRNVDLNMTSKEVSGQNAPVGAALVAQAMNGGDARMRYKAMQAVKDWDRTRLAYRAVKRAFDIVFSGCVLAVIAIPSLVLAAAIRLESEGNPFFSQIRVGQTHRDGSLSTFRMWKFRSMYKDADERLADLKEQNEIAGAMFKMKEDPRVTRIGKFIRKHSIDEFPQFLNVFLGQMSIVGPRPALPAEVATYNDYQRQRLLVKPGMTCYWQTRRNRDSITFDEWVDLDPWELNGDLRPDGIVSGSARRVWWRCGRGHAWRISAYNGTGGADRGCPCCGDRKALKGYNDLRTTHPEITRERNKERNGDLKPTDAIASSNKRVRWKYREGHEWSGLIANRARRGKAGPGCPYCSGRKVLAGYTTTWPPRTPA